MTTPNTPSAAALDVSGASEKQGKGKLHKLKKMLSFSSKATSDGGVISATSALSTVAATTPRSNPSGIAPAQKMTTPTPRSDDMDSNSNNSIFDLDRTDAAAPSTRLATTTLTAANTGNSANSAGAPPAAALATSRRTVRPATAATPAAADAAPASPNIVMRALYAIGRFFESIWNSIRSFFRAAPAEQGQPPRAAPAADAAAVPLRASAAPRPRAAPAAAPAATERRALPSELAAQLVDTATQRSSSRLSQV